MSEITTISQAIKVLTNDYNMSVELLLNDIYKISDDDDDWDGDFFYTEDELLNYVNELKETSL